MGGLQGRVAVVTGGSGAIGTVIAERLAAEGATVFATDLPSIVGGRSDAEPPTAFRLVAADVCDESSLRGVRDDIMAEHGRIDVLVNAAALFRGLTRAGLWDLDLAEWDRTFEVNVRGCFSASRVFAEAMRGAAYGRIINISSNVVAYGAANFLQYVASKAAVIGITRGMARELAPHGITVNAIAPAYVESGDDAIRRTLEQRTAWDCPEFG